MVADQQPSGNDRFGRFDCDVFRQFGNSAVTENNHRPHIVRQTIKASCGYNSIGSRRQLERPFGAVFNRGTAVYPTQRRFIVRQAESQARAVRGRRRFEKVMYIRSDLGVGHHPGKVAVVDQAAGFEPEMDPPIVSRPGFRELIERLERRLGRFPVSEQHLDSGPFHEHEKAVPVGDRSCLCVAGTAIPVSGVVDYGRAVADDNTAGIEPDICPAHIERQWVGNQVPAFLASWRFYAAIW